MSARVRGAIELAPQPSAGALALDLSAGDGLSSTMLAERGWRVVSTEYRTRKSGWVCADLRDDLPFKTARFDLVVMLEVIEHLADIPHAFAEIARVLKVGGSAILSTPNRLNLASRAHYQRTGFYKGRRSPLHYKYRPDDGRNWHVMGLNDLHWIAWSENLRLDALGKSRRKLRSRLAFPFRWPMVYASSWLLYGRGASDPAQAKINRELLRFMTSASLLMDENIIMRFHRGGADG